MITSFDKKSMEGVHKVITELGFNSRQQIKIALGLTAKKVRSVAAKKLRTQLKAPAKVLKKTIITKTDDIDRSLTAVVIMIAGHKIPLKYFKARQTKSGVAYTVNSSDKGKLPHAFEVTKYRRNIYQRQGKERGPLVQQKGPAPGEVYESSGVVAVAMATAQEQLPKQITERIRFLTVKAQGKLKGKQ